jgi:hypothetical protein
VSPLEQAVLTLGEALRSAEFGERLRELHPSRRADNHPFGSLASYELNSAPAIRRTFQTLHLTKLAGEPLQLSDDDRAYIEWVGLAWRATQRIAGRFWSPMPSKIRTTVVDQDDLGPNACHYLPASRVHELGPALKFAGLDSPAIEGLIDAAVLECRATPSYTAALELVKEVEADNDLLKRLMTRQRRVLRKVQPTEKMTISDADDRARLIVREAYSEAEPDVAAVATAVRAHNELVNYILFALLGLAETAQTYVIGSESGPIRARRRRRLLWTHFATFDEQPAFIGHPPSPFVLDGGTPLDGLYMLEGVSLRWSGRGLVDVHARRLRELEEAPLLPEPLTA